MQQFTNTLTVQTRGKSLVEVTHAVAEFVTDTGLHTGLLTVYVRHTSCSLVIQENADPDVKIDLLGYFERLAPEGMEWVSHTAEGPDDMPAHIKASLTETSISIPVIDGRAVFGTWQGLYLFEHRSRPHRRELVLHLIGDA